jgi:hypothetical protein
VHFEKYAAIGRHRRTSLIASQVTRNSAMAPGLISIQPVVAIADKHTRHHRHLLFRIRIVLRFIADTGARRRHAILN